MSNGDSVVQEQLNGMIDNLENTGNEKDPQLIQLRVLSVIWRDLSKVRERQEETESHPSLSYLLRYQTAKTTARIFIVGMGLYVVYSFLDNVVGWEVMLGIVLP